MAGTQARREALAARGPDGRAHLPDQHRRQPVDRERDRAGGLGLDVDRAPGPGLRLASAPSAVSEDSITTGQGAPA